QAEDGIRDLIVTGVQTCALPISAALASIANRPRRSRRSAGAWASPASASARSRPEACGSCARCSRRVAWIRRTSSEIDGASAPRPRRARETRAEDERAPEACGRDAGLRAEERRGVEAVREAKAQAVEREDILRREPAVEDDVEPQVHRTPREVAREPRRVEP